jgi:hypothetical protein
MSPGVAPRVSKVIGVSDDAPARLVRFFYLVGNPVSLAVGDRFFFRLEAQTNLLAHVARAGPAHQRLDFERFARLIFELPVFRPRLAGLHGGLGGLVNASKHVGLGPSELGFPCQNHVRIAETKPS